MSTHMLRLIFFLILIVSARTAPKPLTCLTYMEDDRSLQDYDDDDDDDDDFDENAILQSNVNFNLITSSEDAIQVNNNKNNNNNNIIVAHRRVCQPDYTFCFSLWRQTVNGTHIEKQGCWKESTERNATCSQRECTSSAPTSRNNSLYYCCCSGDLCNQNVTIVEPSPLQLSKQQIIPEASNLRNSDKQGFCSRNYLILWCSVISVCLLISVSLIYLHCRISREKLVPEEAPLAPSGPGYSSNLRNVDNMNLICMLGSGKYGTVMKGMLHDQEVAVKIYPETHHHYYINERNIYSLPLMDCPSLLTYFGYDERHTMDGKAEYHLVLSLAPLGCLQDWLIANTMDFETFCGMAKSITRGLSHLHTEFRIGDDYKPCIAHRDLNSRNVLVKADRTCCIADFGFALKVFGSKYEYKGEIAMAETKSINEVGTLRYMAPELLEGAVNLRDCETSLKQMDVYALGLVLWEIATRCADYYPLAQITPPYKAPYEQEVGAHPNFDQMQALVVRHKARPLFPTGWGGGAAAKLVRDTCEDCWDHDAEARLTSLCAEERMHEIASLKPRMHSLAQSSSPLLSANNLVGEHSEHGQHHNNQVRTLNIAAETCNSETTTMLNPPPNQNIPRVSGAIDFVAATPQTEKNLLICTQQQLQPYQGRNPCQERNLAPTTTRPPQVLVEKSKKHSFQSDQENSFSCLEDDVSVEELISSGSSKKFTALTQENSSMGQGFPKQQNTDRKLRGWHGVRALIQKKLFRKVENSDAFRQLGAYSDEKSNLVDNRYAAVMKGLDNCTTAKTATVSFIDDKQRTPNGVSMTKTTTLDNIYPLNRRPNNLDLSPMGTTPSQMNGQLSNKSLQIHSIAEEFNSNVTAADQHLRATNSHIRTPAHIVPRSVSSGIIKHINNNNTMNKTELKTMTPCSLNTPVAMNRTTTNFDRNFRRQRSLEVFREVFSGRGSTERLRDPSQRVKTPGDVPPSVRKVRASKTLSLYDDRMMDSSTLNVLL